MRELKVHTGWCSDPQGPPCLALSATSLSWHLLNDFSSMVQCKSPQRTKTEDDIYQQVFARALYLEFRVVGMVSSVAIDDLNP